MQLFLIVYHLPLYADRLLVESAALCLLYLVTQRSVNTILDRLHEVETLAIQCAWCKRIKEAGEYIGVSHSICPDCFERELGNLSDIHVTSHGL